MTSNDFRETTIRVAGVERVIRTERAGKVRTVAQLEAAHTKTVKTAIIEARTATAPDTMPHEMAEKLAKRATQFPKCNWVSPRTPLPGVATSDPTEYLVELAPGHYATHDAAESMGASERVDEVVPGLALGRYGKGWTLRHLPSVTDEQPNTHLGPVFKTRKRAREVAMTELARFDFTRSQAEIVADEETAAVVKFVKLREFVAASKKNSWAEDKLRAAEEAVSALALDVAA